MDKEENGFSVEAATSAAKAMAGGFSGSNLPPEILAGIGAVVAEWSYLAFQMTVILRLAHGLTKESQRALLVGAEIGVLCAHFRTIANTDFWIKDAKIRGEIEKLAADIQTASDTRHAYAHGVFGYFSTAPDNRYVRYLMKKAEHRVQPSTEELTVDGLREHVKTARALWERSQAITLRLKGRA